MKICRVIGNVWSSKKNPALEGLKLMIVCSEDSGSRYVAADFVGAGIGETVLVVTGSTARQTAHRENVPIDAAIVGIVDSQEVPMEDQE